MLQTLAPLQATIKLSSNFSDCPPSREKWPTLAGQGSSAQASSVGLQAYIGGQEAWIGGLQTYIGGLQTYIGGPEA